MQLNQQVCESDTQNKIIADNWDALQEYCKYVVRYDWAKMTSDEKSITLEDFLNQL
jgi:hypothetical protein